MLPQLSHSFCLQLLVFMFDDQGPATTLTTRVGFVTGAGAGIGQGIALALARAGAVAVTLVDLPAAKATVDETATQIAALGCKATVTLADVSDTEAISAAMAQTAKEHGRVDIVVACAAWSDRVPLVEQDIEKVRRVLDVCQIGVLNTVKAGAIQMRAQPAVAGRESRGKIIIVSSIMGNLVLSNSASAYSMSKAAITHLGGCLASELAPDRINVNVVCPGWIDTPGERRFMTEEQIAERAPHMPWGRLGTADDVGRTAVFLCSPAADYISGSTLNVDGGYSVSVRLGLGTC